MGGVMFLDENDHVHWTGLSYYDSTEEAERFLNHFGHTLPEAGKAKLVHWVATKRHCVL